MRINHLDSRIVSTTKLQLNRSSLFPLTVDGNHLRLLVIDITPMSFHSIPTPDTGSFVLRSSFNSSSTPVNQFLRQTLENLRYSCTKQGVPVHCTGTTTRNIRPHHFLNRLKKQNVLGCLLFLLPALFHPVISILFSPQLQTLFSLQTTATSCTTIKILHFPFTSRIKAPGRRNCTRRLLSRASIFLLPAEST